MVSSRLEDRIVILSVEGELSADQVHAELLNWYGKRMDEFDGYIIDLNQMTKHPALEQRKAAAYEKKLPSNKPHAIVGKDEKIARLISIFERFTKANLVKYYTNLEEAKAWIVSQS